MLTNNFQVQLPFSKFVINFRSPVFNDRCTVLKSYERETGYTPEDAIAIMCIDTINSNPVPKDTDPQSFMGQMALQDYNHYFDVFSAMFFSDLKKRESAQDIAKKLLSGEDIVGTQKNAPATIPTGKNAG
jgi:hypothetical protein